MENRKLLFISHSEKDSKIVSDFVDLLYAIGLKEENMFCSSLSEIGIPIREDIYNYLRNLLDSDNVIPIFMLSENYYGSAACLNEMGAVWMKQKNDYFTFLLPGFEFIQIKGAINPNRKSIKLDSDRKNLKGELTNFKNEICSLFHTSISENRWEKQRDQFIDKVNTASTDIYIDLSEHGGYCIGETNADGCKVRFDKEIKKVSVTYDFSQTRSEASSLVFHTGERDIHKQFLQNKHLCFQLKSSSGPFQLTVELKLKNRDVSHVIPVTDCWEAYAIPLQDFGGAETEWHVLREVKFLAYRKDIQKGSIEIKDIKIVAV